MCFTKKFRTKALAKGHKPITARKEFAVYKVINKDNTSKHQWFKYKEGTHYTEDKLGISMRDDYTLEINKGLHSFKTEKYAHSQCWGDRKVVEMYIPKGAKYYSNQGYIVSNQLILY